MFPLSPTGYIQPPTPDHPPPSPMTAGMFIQETINPHVSITLTAEILVKKIPYTQTLILH